MIQTCLYFLPIGGVIIGLTSAIAISFWLRSAIQKSFNPMAFIDDLFTHPELKDDLAEAWKSANVEKNIELLIETRLDALVSTFKMQIPMLGMFLSKVREDKLKNDARLELIKLTPSLREYFWNCLNANTAIQESIKICIATKVKKDLEIAIDRFWMSTKYSLIGKSVLLGLCLGLVETGVFIVLC